MNTITVDGNITRDPEIRYNASSTVASFSIASNRSWKNKSTGEWEEEATFFNCSAWGSSPNTSQHPHLKAHQ